MYRHDTGGCGCGGGSATIAHTGTTRRLGRIDEQGRCVCDECRPCDGLACQCRPRFFDGQLLTAADFRRLDHYIVAKDRLHNRYLHGVGVVCGLEVVCSPCDDTVTVRTGYALGPCGEDIVVCEDARVDVGALIKEQRALGARADCGPFSEPGKASEGARQQWVLGICYDERPARPVAGLARTGCGCGGSCGGSCGGGGSCGCGGSTTTAGGASCEPTQVCEGYRFTLTRQRPTDDDTPVRGELPRLVTECLARLRDGLTRLPDDPSTDELVDYAAELKEDLREMVETGNVHDCTLAQRLFDIPIPDPGDENAGPRARAAITAMLQVAVDLFRSCVCSALLPKCDDGCADDCVPLAVLTVRSSDLRVLDICNWSARAFAITMPALQYWLGWIPVFGALRNAISRLCCQPVRRPPRFELDDRQEFGRVRVKAAGEERVRAEEGAEETRTSRADSVRDPASFVALAAQYLDTRSSISGLEATVLGALGARTTDGDPIASDLELANPLAALTLGQLGAPAGLELLPTDLAGRMAPGGAVRPGVSEERVADLEASLTRLRKTVDSQARAIRTLKAKGPGQ